MTHHRVTLAAIALTLMAATGYVYNVYDAHATRVRLNVEALDAAGRLIERRVAYVPLDVPPRGRSFFRRRCLPGPRRPASAC